MSKNFIVLDKIREKLQNYLQGEDLLTQPRKGKKKIEAMIQLAGT